MNELTILGRGRTGRALSAAFGVPNLPHDATPGGWVILAVPDDAIVSMAARFEGRAVHLSGSVHVDGVPCLHPLTSFDGTVQDWTDTPLARTGSVPAWIVERFARIGFVPFDLPAEHKARYHAVAVLTSGHAATLWLGANDLLEEIGVTLPGRGLWPLAEATLKNVSERGAAGRTGPFVRGDEATIARDADALPDEWRKLFLRLGRM